MTIQAILRHSNVAVTQEYYIKKLPQQSVDAMGKFEEKLKQQQADAIAVGWHTATIYDASLKETDLTEQAQANRHSQRCELTIGFSAP